MSEQLRIAGNIQSYMIGLDGLDWIGLDWLYLRPLLQLEHCSESSANNPNERPRTIKGKSLLIIWSVSIHVLRHLCLQFGSHLGEDPKSVLKMGQKGSIYNIYEEFIHTGSGPRGD